MVDNSYCCYLTVPHGPYIMISGHSNSKVKGECLTPPPPPVWVPPPPPNQYRDERCVCKGQHGWEVSRPTCGVNPSCHCLCYFSAVPSLICWGNYTRSDSGEPQRLCCFVMSPRNFREISLAVSKEVWSTAFQQLLPYWYPCFHHPQWCQKRSDLLEHQSDIPCLTPLALASLREMNVPKLTLPCAASMGLSSGAHLRQTCIGDPETTFLPASERSLYSTFQIGKGFNLSMIILVSSPSIC